MTNYNTSKFSFSGHETFSLRFAWLKKGYDAILDNPIFFSNTDKAMGILGVGKNMVRAIKHWGYAAGVVQDLSDSDYKKRAVMPTKLGDLIFHDEGYDPFLEDPGTLWLIHWNLASNADHSTLWYWIFNYWNKPNFNEESILNELQEWLKDVDKLERSRNTLSRDFHCFIRTYVPSKRTRSSLIEDTLDSPLIDLDLLFEISGPKNAYQFKIGAKPTLPNEIFAFALIEFWKNYRSNLNTLTYEQITYEAGSPGKVFKLSPDAIVAYLENIDTTTDGILTYRRDAGIQQVYRNKDWISNLNILKKYYLEEVDPIHV